MMHPLEEFEKHVLKTFRMDLQLHFFWSFALTLTGVFWEPLLVSGLAITAMKEVFDVLAKKGWSWGDFWFGMAGAGTAMTFFHICVS